MKTAYFILVASLIVALVSCKKSGTTDPPPEFANTCFDHVLKEPYLVYDGDHYELMNIPYMKNYDSKANNVSIFVQKKVQEKKEINNVQKV